MAFILLILFEAATYAAVADDLDTCVALQKLNRAYWNEQGVKPITLCMPTVAV